MSSSTPIHPALSRILPPGSRVVYSYRSSNNEPRYLIQNSDGTQYIANSSLTRALIPYYDPSYVTSLILQGRLTDSKALAYFSPASSTPEAPRTSRSTITLSNNSNPTVRSLPWSITDNLSRTNGKLVLGSSGGYVSVSNPNFNSSPVYYRTQLGGTGIAPQSGLAKENFTGGSIYFSPSLADIPGLQNGASVPVALSFFQKDQTGREINTVSATYSYVVDRPLTASLTLNRPDRLYKEGDLFSFSVDAKNISQPFNQVYWKLSGQGLSSSSFTSDYAGRQYGVSLSGAARLVTSAGYNPSGTGTLDYPVNSMLFSRNNTIDGNRKLTLSLYSDSSFTKLLDSEDFTLSDGPAPVAPPTDPVTGGRLVTSTPVRDFLTGTQSADRFLFPALSSSRLDSIDVTTGLQPGTDIIDAPGSFSFADIKQLGRVASLDASGIASLLSAQNFTSGSAAMFSLSTSPYLPSRTFLAINDSVAGFSQNSDSIIEISNWQGDIRSLTII
jgi:hypothetical protein